MKKHILLSFVLGLGLLFFTNSVKSQNFQIVASFGTAQNWAVPNAVLYEIDYYYPYHQIVHINRERRGRSLFFNVLLERRGQFVEVFFGRQAIILDVNYYHNYPLAQHICSGHCGYHGNFYRNYQSVCNHRGRGHGHHRGHNHVAYRSNSNHNSYAYRNGASNRNVRSNYAYNNSREGVRSNSSRSNSNNRSQVNRSSNHRKVDAGNRGNSRARMNTSAKRSESSVRGNVSSRSTESRASSRGKSSSSARSSANARSRN